MKQSVYANWKSKEIMKLSNAYAVKFTEYVFTV